MKVMGQEALAKFTRKHAGARAWVDAWLRTVQDATWRSLDDARNTYPSADGVKLKSGNVVTVFNCKGNEYRLLCYLTYATQTVQVLEVVPHPEYTKNLWKTRY